MLRAGLLLLAGLSCMLSSALAQTAASPAPAAVRQLQAVRITTAAPKLDALLDEAVWQQAPVATDFIQNRPNPGPHEKHPTEVRILYDDAALYVGAIMHDVSLDSIPRELGARDDIGNTDFFGIFLDTYHDKLNGYGFFVTPSGVQMDARYSPAGGEDFNWNAVWESRTALRGTDWVAELRIPYSAIRFSTQQEQVWGLNFMRNRQILRQGFFWSEVKPEVNGFLNQWGELVGIRDIKAPLRLSFTPYISTYVNHYPYKQQGVRNTSTSVNGGADVKWGINESFTLDATLVPDFGQTVSDNRVLNLTPFEVQYNENRQFFTEGTELFNKGNLFYSRRVGAQPMGFYDAEGQLKPGERLVQNPGESRLLNATKISGRTSKGLGVGLFNAVAANMYATAEDEQGEQRRILTQPLANYNIFVLDQSLKNNSYVSLINTNVTRQGSTYDANVTGGLFRLANKKNSYAVDGQVVYSRRRGQYFNSDTEVGDQDGYKYLLGVGKISGGFTWRLSQGIESNGYNPNDLGILFSNNSISQVAELNFNRFKPFWKVNNAYSYLVLEHRLLYRPTAYTSAGAYFGGNTTFTKSFITVGFNGDYTAQAHDYFEPRTEIGTYYVRFPANVGGNGFISTDYRKKLAFDLSTAGRWFQRDGIRPRRTGYGVSLSPRYRVSNQLSFRYNFEWNTRPNQVGYVNGGLDPDQFQDGPLAAAGQILLGRRRVMTYVNTITGTYTFNNRMSFNIRTRHYTSSVHYYDFTVLRPQGQELKVDYRRNRDNAFNAFNVDANFSWWFAPGSQVNVVWKNALSNELLAEESTPLYFDNLSRTINTPHSNSLSVKVLYFLDYLTLRKRRA
ncbi:hypothetical protein HER32_06080 [Hymenobacter sp. BT18]|uniref:DUF5916 domain-containing protein n=1 Tax=Hymenobacter sp. BT18 TaxID=2835648 RepID=UPI00143EAC98|nr:DUF5916 domain-containing protein [Hymenobacter sp. BT18]QIX60766.1 hypothetical protein HER32_06080 [Hymenobacter sp. BT18]